MEHHVLACRGGVAEAVADVEPERNGVDEPEAEPQCQVLSYVHTPRPQSKTPNALVVSNSWVTRSTLIEPHAGRQLIFWL